MLALALLSVAVTEPPRYAPPADFAAKAGELMAARAAHRGFSGTVLVAHQGKPLFAAGYGLANRDYDLPNTVATKYRIGSITKQLTAACVLILEERGQLKVSDPLAKHLPDCPKAWADVTLHQLLSHTAGVPEHALKLFAGGLTGRPHTPAQIVALVKDRPLDFKPGEKWKYSNTGYILLGMVVEMVSGKKYADFLREAVLTPAGMTDTAVETTGAVLKDRATGYSGPERQGQFVHMTVPYASGAVYSTAGDLVKWDRALAGDTVLGPAARKTLFAEVRDGYAAGIGVGTRFGRPYHSHGGGIPGFVAEFTRYPADGLAVVVLANTDDGRPGVVAGALAAIAFGKPYVVPRKLDPAPLPRETLDRLAGRYRDGDRTLAVARVNDRLTLKSGKAAEVTYTPLAADRFAAAGPDWEAEAVFTSADGRPTAVTVRETGTETRWKRAD